MAEIQDILDELVRRETHQTETLAAIQNEILTAIKGVRNEIASLHSTYRSIHEEPARDTHRAA
jgi:phage host-nuclease inhibitor protein Gam